MHKRDFLLILSLVAVLKVYAVVSAAPAGAAQKAGWEQKWETLQAEAKKEGQVRLYAAWSVDTRNGISKGFKNRFGVDVEWQAFGRGDEIPPRVVNEQRAGLYLADGVGMGMNTIYVSMKPGVALTSLQPLLVLPEVTDPKVWRVGRVPFFEKESYGVGFLSNAQRYVVRNADQVKDGEITSYKDLLKPQFKGKIIMDDPTLNGPGSTMMSLLARGIWNEEQALQFLKDLIVKQEMVLNRNNRLQVEATARGKYAIAIASRGEIVDEFQKAGAHLTLTPVREGVSVITATGGFAIPAKAPHPNAAALLLNWLLTREGQAVISKGFGIPSARVDVSSERIDPLRFTQPGERVFGESADSAAYTGKIIRLCTELINSLPR